MNVGEMLDSPWARLVSVMFAVFCLWSASHFGPDAFLDTVAYLIFVLAFVWFGKYLEHYSGWANCRLVTAATPGTLLQAMGWVMLLIGLAMSIASLARR